MSTLPVFYQVVLSSCGEKDRTDPVSVAFFVALKPNCPLTNHLLAVGPELEAEGHIDRATDF